jgi:hypothetical protein
MLDGVPLMKATKPLSPNVKIVKPLNRYIGIVIALCAIPVTLYAATVFVGPKPDGYHIGLRTTDLIGFFGRKPASQPASTRTARLALEDLGLIAPGGSDTTNTDALSKAADDTIADGVDYALGTSTGSKIGGAANQKLGFHGATPVVQSVATVTAFKAAQDHGLIASGSDYSVQHVQVSLAAADLIAMYATPVQLVAAQGSGKSIVPTRVVFRIARTSTAFTGGGAVYVQYAATAHGAGTQALDSTLASTVVTGASGTTDSFRNGAVVSDVASTVTENVGLYISNDTAAFAAGTGTATCDVWYVVR